MRFFAQEANLLFCEVAALPLRVVFSTPRDVGGYSPLVVGGRRLFRLLLLLGKRLFLEGLRLCLLAGFGVLLLLLCLRADF